MKKFLFFSIMVGFSGAAWSQVPEDAGRFSWNPHNGSARYMAIGGVMGSLGGDITATYVNPAGLGFYRTREIVFTPGYNFNAYKTSYLDSTSKYKNNRFNLGTTGLVVGWSNKNNIRNSTAVSVAINQTADFRNSIRYKSLNNYSSFGEQFAEEFAKSGYSIDDVLQSNSPLPYSSAPALYTYLIDTARVNGTLQVKAAPEFLLDKGQAISQEYLKNTYGGIYELAFAAAQNDKDKWLYGATIGVPLVYYKSESSFTERDTSGNTKNGFASFTYNDNFKTTGAGINLKLGVIYRPQDFIRLGLAVHSPSLMVLTDTHSSYLSTQLEDSSGNIENFNVSSNTFTNDQPGSNEYVQTTPWKAIISASYVFREVENTKRQRGFISADVEYISHKSSRFSSFEDEPTEEEKTYYKALGNVVKNYYKGNFNFRVGGELKFNTIMGRLGFAYYTSPYKDKLEKARQMLLSGGLGYRNKGFFIDVTYAYNMKKNTDYAYRLEDRANTYASLNKNAGNLIATVGIKF